METPSTEDLIRIDRAKKDKKVSNKDCKSPVDADARIVKMKDGTTHLAYKPEHAVDLCSGVIVAAVIHPADFGDTRMGEHCTSLMHFFNGLIKGNRMESANTI